MDENETPRRKRRTKAEMEEARALEATSIPVDMPDESPETPVKRKRRKSKNDSEGLYKTLEGLRQGLQLATGGRVLEDNHTIVGGSIYLPTASESPFIIRPIANLASRHLDVPNTDNPDINDAVTLLVGLFGMYRLRVRDELAAKRQRAVDSQQNQQSVPFTPVTNQPQSEETFSQNGNAQPMDGESMAEFAARQRTEYQEPVAAPRFG